MEGNSSRFFRLSAKAQCQARLATLAVVGMMALASAATAGPIEVALVENSNSPNVEFMEYVHAGQVIRLGPHETIVLRYMNSCVRETISGGTVIVGTDRSDVRSGEVARLMMQCDAGHMEATNALTPFGGRIVRGLPSGLPK